MILTILIFQFFRDFAMTHKKSTVVSTFYRRTGYVPFNNILCPPSVWGVWEVNFPKLLARFKRCSQDSQTSKMESFYNNS